MARPTHRRPPPRLRVRDRATLYIIDDCDNDSCDEGSICGMVIDGDEDGSLNGRLRAQGYRPAKHGNPVDLHMHLNQLRQQR